MQVAHLTNWRITRKDRSVRSELLDLCLENFGCQHDSGRGETQVGFAHCQGDHENTKPKPHVMTVCHVCHVCHASCETRYVWQPGLLYGMWLVPLCNKFEKTNWLLLCCHLQDWNWSFAGVWSCCCHQIQSCATMYLVTLCILLSQAVLPCQCFHQWHLPLVSMHCCKRGSNTFPLSLNLDGCRVHENKLWNDGSVYMCHSTIRQFENALELYSDTAVTVTIRCDMSDIVFWLRTTHTSLARTDASFLSECLFHLCCQEWQGPNFADLQHSTQAAGQDNRSRRSVHFFGVIQEDQLVG